MNKTAPEAGLVLMIIGAVLWWTGVSQSIIVFALLFGTGFSIFLFAVCNELGDWEKYG